MSARCTDIRLDPGNPEQVSLLFAIERGTPIKEDTEAVLKTQGLTGIAYVELSGGSPNSPPLRGEAPASYPEIRTKPSLSARLENVLTTLMAKLDSTSDSVNAILSDENVAAFKQHAGQPLGGHADPRRAQGRDRRRHHQRRAHLRQQRAGHARSSPASSGRRSSASAGAPTRCARWARRPRSQRRAPGPATIDSRRQRRQALHRRHAARAASA